MTIPNATAPIDAEWTVSDLETLKLLANPLRARILQEVIPRALSVKQIASALGEPITKLYRHVDLMEEHGVIRVVGQIVVSGIPESYYRARARTYLLDRKLFPSERGEPVLDAALDFVLDRSRTAIQRGVADGVIDVAQKPPEPTALLARRVQVMLTPERARRLSERVVALLDELGDEQEPSPDRRAYSIAVVLHPTSDDD